MFYEFEDKAVEKRYDTLTPGKLSAGIITIDELKSCGIEIGFSPAVIESCTYVSPSFRTGISLHGDYTFTELRVPDREIDSEDDCMALFIKKDLFLLVDVEDEDGSTGDTFLSALNRIDPKKADLERLICSFFSELIINDAGILESIDRTVSGMEESILDGTPSKEFNREILTLKRKVQRLHSIYGQYLDILGSINEDLNDLLPKDTAHLQTENLITRIERLNEDALSIAGDLTHLQDAYTTYVETNTNKKMNYLTVLTTIFFPLTIIVGWYGMNFLSMPEFNWKYGYVYVISLSVTAILTLTAIAKRNKWF